MMMARWRRKRRQKKAKEKGGGGHGAAIKERSPHLGPLNEHLSSDPVLVVEGPCDVAKLFRLMRGQGEGRGGGLSTLATE